MLSVMSEPLVKLKARFTKAVSHPVDVQNVLAGIVPVPSGLRKHVFDFEDGMRMIVSIDIISGTYFLHVSVSGNDSYLKSIESEGFDGLVEDSLLRITAFTNGTPSDNLRSTISNSVLHLIFEVDYAEFIERVKRA